MLTTLPFSGFYNSKWSDELDNVENKFIENEAENDERRTRKSASGACDADERTCEMNPFPSGTYIGTYKGVPFYSDRGEYQCLFGWIPQRFHSIRQLKINVTKWRKS